MKRIGLFGGSFDPAHLGHVLVAHTAHEELALDKLFIIPAAQSPFKPETPPTPPELRAAMLRVAFCGCAWAELDAQEIERGGVSYTIDTIRVYRKVHPAAEIFFLIGADHVPLLPKWREAGELAELVTFAVIPRPGQPEITLPEPFRGKMLSGHPLGVSASQIRKRVQCGKQFKHLVPSGVADMIRHNQLYL